MEDALVRFGRVLRNRKRLLVLILVLMEDALVPRVRHPLGRGRGQVLILVLMEDALVPPSTLSNTRAAPVLILVLMEDALVLYYHDNLRTTNL